MTFRRRLIGVASLGLSLALAGCNTGNPSIRPSGNPTGSGKPGPSSEAKTAASPAGPLGLVAKAKTATDKKGDVVNAAGKAVTKLGAADVTAIEARADGRNLLVSMTLVEAAPPSLKAAVYGVSYTVAIEINGSGKADYWLSVENREDGRWVGVVSNWVDEASFSDDEASGAIAFSKTRVHVRVALSLIGNPSRVRVQGGSQWTAPDQSVVAQDVIPNGTLFVPDPGWLALGT